jgi:hypothetical protein
MDVRACRCRFRRHAGRDESLALGENPVSSSDRLTAHHRIDVGLLGKVFGSHELRLPGAFSLVLSPGVFVRLAAGHHHELSQSLHGR